MTDQLLTDILNFMMVFSYAFMWVVGFIAGIKLASLLPY